MKIIRTITEMQEQMKRLKSEGKTIGYVPTMGFLHEGHRSLMNRARPENDVAVLSIFVNPLQFGPAEDLDAYPRDFERDHKIAEAEGVDFIFYPSAEEMYPGNASIKVSVVERTNVLCGRSRPGHFDGVATVLFKLFNIIQPTRAYFGLKDAQQVAVVDGLIKDFNFPIELIPVETVREEDGLAKSSRNVYLNDEERIQAVELSKSLKMAKLAIDNGERNADELVRLMKNHINENTTGTVDYIEIYTYPELQELETLKGKVIIALAVKFSKARLIDNTILEVE
ncbi:MULTISPECIES: pantoate--beta-alanine ligase [unclassified Bacillus (in: firmicutes)]|uniref:pantoate--beta-alanine ligase n=1 Tax=unclassified Bacillus (in: firmicutes) TaxID=185979 RepID=UPI001BECE559|nr:MULTISPECIES: pantoate--beta-alanine ligase [unclassified Bacillus (in: firmicutes)]MBT2639077.1 pantoate--beta-alanine ligase [Bacillus sp. ISL-39]MBT2662314.1 pantoate--beta-alanine ligase [Bacillus sp. ISL-45]